MALGKSPRPQDYHVHVCTLHPAKIQKCMGWTKARGFDGRTGEEMRVTWPVGVFWERANTRIGFTEQDGPGSCPNRGACEEEVAALVTREVTLQQHACFQK